MSGISQKTIANKLVIGRNEWFSLPNLNLPFIKGKIDTGAKTSAIHAVNIKRYSRNREDHVSFDVNPIQGNNKLFIHCRATIIDERFITSSNGHKERRYVIKTSLGLCDKAWEIELTLSNRDPLRYRLLIGREAMNHRVLIHPGIACHQSQPAREKILKAYKNHPDAFYVA